MKKIITYGAIGTFSLLVGCAAPALQYYTLTEGGNIIPQPSRTQTSSDNATVIYIVRVTVPDYLNTTDITTRHDTVVNHSVNGRMSSILSVGATGFIANLLTDKNPNLWITNESPVMPPNYQLMINIRRFDLQADPDQTGKLTIEATWSIIPKDSQLPIQKQRTNFVVQGSIKTDSEIIQLEQKALTQLTDSINTTIQQLR